MYNVLFFVSLLITIFLCNIADRKNKKIILYIAIIILSIIVGFRGQNVGIDTPNYYYSITHDFPYSWLFPEKGFRLISSFLFHVFNNGHIVLFVFSIITNGLIFSRLWDFRKKCNFSLMCFIFLALYVFSMMNIMRQFIAIAIIFYSTKLLDNKKYISFLVIVLLTTLIHKTALLGAFLIFPYIWNSLNSKKKFLMIIPILILGYLGIRYGIYMESKYIDNYLSSEKTINGFNYTFLYHILIFIFSYIIYKKKILFTYKNKKYEYSLDNNESFFNTISMIYFSGLIVSMLGLYFNNLTRVSSYYLIFECVYWGYLFKSSQNKFFNLSLISVFSVYAFLMECLNNGSGIFPYTFL